MVLLTMTPSIVEGLDKLQGSVPRETMDISMGELSLEDPAIGQPIIHGQVVGLWKALKDAGLTEYSLEHLLRGSNVYVPPPPQKPEPSSEFQALMARLRREEEQRIYERMANPPQPLEKVFPQRYSTASSMVYAFTEVNKPIRDTDLGDNDVTYIDVHRQLMLILNFVVSIVGVAATLWILARWWPTPSRLSLAMGGGILVGAAEVAVYSGYVWHLEEAKRKDKKLKEVRKVVQTWVIGNNGDEGVSVKTISTQTTKASLAHNNLKRRKH